jgi:hypothetical protein
MMGDDLSPSENLPYQAELDGVLLQAVEQARSEPLAEPSLARVVSRAGGIGNEGPAVRRRLPRRLLIAAVVAVAALVAVVSVWDRRSRAWALVVEAVAAKPWLHATGTGPDGEKVEMWFSARHQVFATRRGTEALWLDRQQQTMDVYDATDNTIVRAALDRDDQREFALTSASLGALTSGNARGALEVWPGKFVLEEEKTVDEGGKRWIEFLTIPTAPGPDRRSSCGWMPRRGYLSGARRSSPIPFPGMSTRSRWTSTIRPTVPGAFMPWACRRQPS